MLSTLPAVRRRARDTRAGADDTLFLVNETVVTQETVRALALEANLERVWLAR